MAKSKIIKPTKPTPKTEAPKSTKGMRYIFAALALPIMALMSVVLIIADNREFRPSTVAEYESTSVMVTNMRGNSGGSGVVLTSDGTGSTILTNNHVCAITKKGGLVIYHGDSLLVQSIKQSKVHDLCLVKVKEDLHVNTIVAANPPAPFSDCFISGYPGLDPFVLSKGHFSTKRIISIMVDMRACTEAEFGQNPIQCMFAGFPIVKQYDAQMVSATIMAGSSGSAVFDSHGEIAGLAFAGKQGLSHAYIVPLEYIKEFLDKEQYATDWFSVSNTNE